MSGQSSRRQILKQAAMATGTCALATRVLAADSNTSLPTTNTQPAQALAAYPFTTNVWVRINGEPFACYRAAPTLKYPYWFPIAGPSTGLPMTEEAGDPYPHHRSLIFACDRVNGGNYWQEGLDHGRIASAGPVIDKATAERVEVTDACEWQRPGKETVITDQRRYTLTAPSADLRLIDAEIKLTAATDVQVAKTNHSLFAIRAARPLTPVGGGLLLNAAGQNGEKATFGQQSPWCGYQGTRLGLTESIVLMDHPQNPWREHVRWFTRDYGFISPTPFFWMDDGWRLPAGESIRMRYRVAILAGPIVATGVNGLYEGWGAA